MNLSLEAVLSSVDLGWKKMHWTCGLADCHSKRFLRSVPQSCMGIRLGETWYCSIDCFVKAARKRFAGLARGRSLDMPYTPRVSIGSILLAKGYLTREQFHDAEAQGRATGEELEEVVVRQGVVDEWHLASARATQWGRPVLGRDRISLPVDAGVPLRLMKSFSAVPLHYSERAQRLLVGFVYRVEHSLLHSLEQMMGCRAEPCFITPTELHYQVERQEAARDSREVVFEDSMTALEMANAVGVLALEIRAREVRFSHCQEYVWMRVSGKRKRIDALFRGSRTQVIRQRNILEDSGEGIRAVG